MADIKAHAGAANLDTGAPIEEWFHDNGDGTLSRYVAVQGTLTAIAAKGNKALGTPTINNSATLLLAANANRKTAIITNPKTATQTLYIGVSGVTTSSYTVSLEPGDTYIDNDSSDAWYGVVASSTLVPNVTEVA
jgi:hypothetical protein